MTIQDYLNLVTEQYEESPDFLAMISLGMSCPVQVQSLMTQMQSILFNLSTPAIGNQLDIIGQWVGISRDVSIPAIGIYFSWDDTVADGWDAGSWAPTDSPPTIVALPDDAYLNLINAKIAANKWDGSTEQFYDILSEAFPMYTILLVDHQDMSYSLGIIGNPVDSLTLALFTGGYIPVRPEGVMVSDYFTNTNTGPIFGWDLDTSAVQGWDDGSWVTILT
jgi:Protein of unknown function (DUF2612)